MRLSQHILKMLAAARETGRTADQLASVSGSALESVIATCGALQRLGFARECERERGRRAWCITSAGQQALAESRETPQVLRRRSPSHSVAQSLWRVLRMNRKAGTAELLVLTGAAERPALLHLRSLERAGYLTRVGDSRRGPQRDARWLLLRDTGPLTPYLVNVRREVWDPNTGTATPLYQEAAHV